eukprot:maker-scaffold133_size323035-snap-gene-2.24 protein:Tk02244 transcript:maker-scaffold133_size323035-snap-gene-2.24-mRNA-1 annotation:"signal transducing adapter molecule 1-like"
MPLFGGASNPFEADIDKITNEKNTGEDWGLIMDLCDRISTAPNGAKDALRCVMKRLNHPDPHVVMQAITLLDACVSNCGRNFRLEVASRDFEKSFLLLLRKSHPKIQEKLKTMLKKWAEGEFKEAAEYSLIPGLYAQLKREGIDFNSDQPRRTQMPKDPNVVMNQQEEDDIAKAIELSLKAEARALGNHGGAKQPQNKVAQDNKSLYPQANLASVTPAQSENGAGFSESKKGRALYDFEAAEDNELTFKTGEIVIIVDDSDVNWWKGSNHRGEGLFPANFVTTDLKAQDKSKKKHSSRRRSVQFNEEVEVKTVEAPAVPLVTEIDEAKLDQVLQMLHEANPTNDENDPPALAIQEEQANLMGPLVDNELEVVDRRYAQLSQLSTQLVDSLNFYHQLMRDIPASQPPQSMPSMHNGGYPGVPYPGSYTGAPPPPPSMYNMPPQNGGYVPPPGSMAEYNPVIYGSPMGGQTSQNGYPGYPNGGPPMNVHPDGSQQPHPVYSAES